MTLKNTIYFPFRFIIASVVSTTMAIPHTYAANKSTPASQESLQLQKLGQYRDYLEPMGYEINFNKQSQSAHVKDKKTQKIVMEIPLDSSEKLKRYSPQNTNKILQQQMQKMKTANKLSWEHTNKNFPAESAVFFMAMGAVSATQLLADYAQNPIGLQQHLQHQLSPVGAMSFWAFMYSQGVTTNILQMSTRNPKFNNFIPYLGMTVGVFVQSYLSSFAADPNVKACGYKMIGGKIPKNLQEMGADDSACEKAFEYFVLHKKLWEYSPGIFSMLVSTAVSGGVQMAIAKGTLKLTGVDISMWLIPGAVQVKGIRLLLVKGLQMSFFVGLDAMMSRHLIYAWKNVWDGRELGKLDSELNVELRSSIKNGDATKLNEQLKFFNRRMSDWRMTNLAEVYEAHQAWTENLNNLSSMYNSTWYFYSNMMDAVAASKNNSEEVKLNRKFPLYGVTANGLSEDRKDLLHTFPQMAIHSQRMTLDIVASEIRSDLKKETYKKVYGLQQKEIEKINQIGNLISDTDDYVRAEGIQQLNTEITKMRMNSSASPLYRKALAEIKSKLGTNAQPLLEPGRGFIATFEEAPSTQQYLKNTYYPASSGIFRTEKITDYLTVQMICGPQAERNQSVVLHKAGFPAIFIPPTLLNANKNFESICSNIGPLRSIDLFYNLPMTNEKGSTVKGGLEIIKSDIAERKSVDFIQWWQDNVDTQMKNAFEVYETEYSNIVSTLLQKINATKRSKTNMGPVSNGGMMALFQDLRYNLNIIKAVTTSKAQSQNGTLGFANTNLTEFDLKTSITTTVHPHIENSFAVLNGMIQKFKVTESQGKVKILTSVKNADFEKQLQNALDQINTLETDSKAVAAASKLSKSQIETITIASSNLKNLAQELGLLYSMVRAVSWDSLKNTEQTDADKEKINRTIEEKMRGIRGRLTPGA